MQTAPNLHRCIVILRYPVGKPPSPGSFAEMFHKSVGQHPYFSFPFSLRRVEVLVGQVVGMELRAAKFGRVGTRNGRHLLRMMLGSCSQRRSQGLVGRIDAWGRTGLVKGVHLETSLRIGRIGIKPNPQASLLTLTIPTVPTL